MKRKRNGGKPVFCESKNVPKIKTVTSLWDEDCFPFGTMTLPFSIIEQFEDKFYFKEFVYPFLDELEKYLPDEYIEKIIHKKG